jgi:hypothetical protein
LLRLFGFASHLINIGPQFAHVLAALEYSTRQRQFPRGVGALPSSLASSASASGAASGAGASSSVTATAAVVNPQYWALSFDEAVRADADAQRAALQMAATAAKKSAAELRYRAESGMLFYFIVTHHIRNHRAAICTVSG